MAWRRPGWLASSSEGESVALKVPNEGELLLLSWLRQDFNGTQALVLRLFQNDKTPADADTLGDYDEADFSGYSSQQPLQSWGAVFLESGKAKTVEAVHQFTHDGGGVVNDVFGYLVEDPNTTTLMWAERFASAPIVMDSAADVIFVTPTLTCRSEN